MTAERKAFISSTRLVDPMAPLTEAEHFEEIPRKPPNRIGVKLA
jgi:hypothetical protein